MKIEKNDMVMVYDGGGTVPHCKYAGRFGDLTAYWQECVPSSKNRQIRLSNFDTLMLTSSGRAGAVAAGPPAA